MSRTVNAGGLYNSTAFGFSHAVIQSKPRTAHLAGQVAWDSSGELVGKGDLVAQLDQVFANLYAVLTEVGATPAGVLRLRTYLVKPEADDIALVCGRIGQFFGGETPPANTLLQVAGLAMPEFLLDFEATAEID